MTFSSIMISRMIVGDALALERAVANGKSLVDHQDFRVDGHRERKAQARLHAARVRAHRLVDVQAKVGELDDLGLELFNLVALQARRI
ncbi:MAG: hypothetical protein V8T51_03825 [Senegalimassilia faecalis]